MVGLGVGSLGPSEGEALEPSLAYAGDGVDEVAAEGLGVG